MTFVILSAISTVYFKSVLTDARVHHLIKFTHMNLHIQSIHFNASDDLTNRVEEKLGKLNTHYPFITNTYVYLRKDTGDGETVEVESRLKSAGEIFAKATDATFETALDQVLDKIERQLRKHKDKIQNHH